MEIVSWVICCAALVLALAKAFHTIRPRLNVPLGPKPRPIIGNLNLIGPLPHVSMLELSMKYGSIMQLYFGSVPVIVLSSRDMAKKFLQTDDLNFASRPRTAAGRYTTYDHTDVLWAPYGPYLRPVADPEISFRLFNVKRLDLYEHIRVDELRSLISNVYSSSGKAITLKKYLTSFTLNNISRMILGKQYLGSKPGIPTPEEFKQLLDEWFLLNGVFNIGDFIPWFGFLDLQGYVKRMKALEKKLDGFLDHVVDDHMTRPQDDDSEYTEDMLDVLLKLARDPNQEIKLSKSNVKALIQDLLAGGTDTSSLTVEWAMSELMKHPEAVERATEELDRVIGKERWVSERDILRLPYIEAITKETLRIHPPAPILAPHLSIKDCKMDGYDIVAGTRIIVNVQGIGKDPKLWDSPMEFKPERFIGSDIDVKGRHFELLPFGSGRRMCPGYTLGLKFIQTSLANLIHGFNWKLPEDTELGMEEAYGLTVHRKVPLVVVAQPRLSSHLYSR